VGAEASLRQPGQAAGEGAEEEMKFVPKAWLHPKEIEDRRRAKPPPPPTFRSMIEEFQKEAMEREKLKAPGREHVFGVFDQPHPVTRWDQPAPKRVPAPRMPPPRRIPPNERKKRMPEPQQPKPGYPRPGPFGERYQAIFRKKLGK
jgi:hypothetical protein